MKSKFVALSAEVSYKIEVLEVKLSGTPERMKGKYVCKVAPSGKSLPGRFKSREILWLIVRHDNVLDTKSIVAPMDRRVINSST